jgi:hypothetical protein
MMGSPDAPQLSVSETGFFLPTKQLPFSIMVKHQCGMVVGHVQIIRIIRP